MREKDDTDFPIRVGIIFLNCHASVLLNVFCANLKRLELNYITQLHFTYDGSPSSVSLLFPYFIPALTARLKFSKLSRSPSAPINV